MGNTGDCRNNGKAENRCSKGFFRIEARRAEADLRTFGCRNCKHVHKAGDPLKSNKARWLNSALKPPE
jgi:hypothetical protein